MSANDARRKLIDLSESTFDALSVRAKAEGVSFKRYIETLLDKEAEKTRSSIPESVTDTRIINLVGIAKR